jgi:hypothetical protein
MAFGFDPSIILSASRASERSIGDTLQQLGQVRAQRMQEQIQQASLADQVRRQAQEAQLADIYRANAGSLPEGLPRSLALGGFGPQAFAAQDQGIEAGARQAGTEKLKREAETMYRKHIAEQFYGTSGPDDYAARVQDLASSWDPLLALYAQRMPKYDPAYVKRLGESALGPEKRADIEQRGLDRASGETRARIMAQVRRDVAASGGSADDLTPEALDAMAAQYAVTGQLPPGLGMGKSGAGLRVKIANRASELAPGADLAGARADYGANSKSLAKQQQQADAMNAFEGTALKNLDTFLETAKSVVDTGSPLFNAPGRKFAEQVRGDPKMAAFNTARATAVQEVGKVLSGSLGSAAISDGARHEVESLLKPDASLAQIMAAAQILKRDMENRRASVAAQIEETRGRMKGKPKAAAPASGKLSQEEADELAQLKKELGQ